jgi:hypothetical protein
MSDDNTKPIKTEVFYCLPCNVPASFVLQELRLRSKSFGQQLIWRLGRTQGHSGHCKEENISCSSQNRANICLYSSLCTKHYTMNNHSSSHTSISEEIQINIKILKVIIINSNKYQILKVITINSNKYQILKVIINSNKYQILIVIIISSNKYQIL